MTPGLRELGANRCVALSRDMPKFIPLIPAAKTAPIIVPIFRDTGGAAATGDRKGRWGDVAVSPGSRTGRTVASDHGARPTGTAPKSRRPETAFVSLFNLLRGESCLGVRPYVW